MQHRAVVYVRWECSERRLHSTIPSALRHYEYEYCVERSVLRVPVPIIIKTGCTTTNEYPDMAGRMISRCAQLTAWLRSTNHLQGRLSSPSLAAVFRLSLQ
eukprot:scaffold185824_cov22-Prasinocladus_malaysianus.AAC.1